jgi:hypothetical protein
MTAGIANPQLKAGGLQIRRNEGTAKRLACPVSREEKNQKKSCLKRNILYFCGKINSKTP